MTSQASLCATWSGKNLSDKEPNPAVHAPSKAFDLVLARCKDAAEAAVSWGLGGERRDKIGEESTLHQSCRNMGTATTQGSHPRSPATEPCNVRLIGSMPDACTLRQPLPLSLGDLPGSAVIQLAAFSGALPPCRAWNHALNCVKDDAKLVASWLFARCPSENDALLRAVKHGRPSLVTAVLDHARDLQTLDPEALTVACLHGHSQVVETLLCRGWDVHGENGAQAVSAAARGGHVHVARTLQERGADLHVSRDKALNVAAEEGQLSMVKFLIEQGADPQSNDNAPLLLAAQRGHLSTVRLLLEQGADIHARIDGALILASQEGHSPVVDLLLRSGAAVRTANDAPLRLAAQHGHPVVVQQLLLAGANVHVEDDEPLRVAVSRRHVDVVRILLAHGADETAAERAQCCLFSHFSLFARRKATLVR